jgi:hypothetical protein
MQAESASRRYMRLPNDAHESGIGSQRRKLLSRRAATYIGTSENPFSMMFSGGGGGGESEKRKTSPPAARDRAMRMERTKETRPLSSQGERPTAGEASKAHALYRRSGDISMGPRSHLGSDKRLTWTSVRKRPVNRWPERLRVVVTASGLELLTWLFAPIGSDPHIVATRAAPVEMTLAMPAKWSENDAVLASTMWALLANANLVVRARESPFGHPERRHYSKLSRRHLHTELKAST